VARDHVQRVVHAALETLVALYSCEITRINVLCELLLFCVYVPHLHFLHHSPLIAINSLLCATCNAILSLSYYKGGLSF